MEGLVASGVESRETGGGGGIGIGFGGCGGDGVGGEGKAYFRRHEGARGADGAKYGDSVHGTEWGAEGKQSNSGVVEATRDRLHRVGEVMRMRTNSVGKVGWNARMCDTVGEVVAEERGRGNCGSWRRGSARMVGLCPVIGRIGRAG